jgi:hypothetical protein
VAATDAMSIAGARAKGLRNADNCSHAFDPPSLDFDPPSLDGAHPSRAMKL